LCVARGRGAARRLNPQRGVRGRWVSRLSGQNLTNLSDSSRMCTSDAIKYPCYWKDIHMPKLYSIEVVTVEKHSARSMILVRKTHQAWTWSGALRWVACYHVDHGWAVAVKRLGRVVAMRGVHD
jgi:hypothetical protein